MAVTAQQPSFDELQERRNDEAVRAVLQSRMNSEAFVSEEKMSVWFESLASEKPLPMPTPDIFD